MNMTIHVCMHREKERERQAYLTPAFWPICIQDMEMENHMLNGSNLQLGDYGSVSDRQSEDTVRILDQDQLQVSSRSLPCPADLDDLLQGLFRTIHAQEERNRGSYGFIVPCT